MGEQSGTKVIVAADLDAQATQVIESGLREYNLAQGGDGDGGSLAVTLLDLDTGTPIGGLRGRTSYGILYIDLLFVPAQLRGSGIGAELVRAAEEEARRRGCTMAMLFTFAFQAPGFYLKLGYEEFGRVETDPPSRSRIYMKKRLTADMSASFSRLTDLSRTERLLHKSSE